jgi:hypothetical protein
MKISQIIVCSRRKLLEKSKFLSVGVSVFRTGRKIMTLGEPVFGNNNTIFSCW